MVKKDNSKKEVDRYGCKYEDFMSSQPLRFTGEPTLVAVMDWIYEMEAVFESCACGDQ